VRSRSCRLGLLAGFRLPSSGCCVDVWSYSALHLTLRLVSPWLRWPTLQSTQSHGEEGMIWNEKPQTCVSVDSRAGPCRRAPVSPDRGSRLLSCRGRQVWGATVVLSFSSSDATAVAKTASITPKGCPLFMAILLAKEEDITTPRLDLFIDVDLPCPMFFARCDEVAFDLTDHFWSGVEQSRDTSRRR